MTEDSIPAQWLQSKLSLEQVEAQNSVNGVPFGGLSDEWIGLKSQMIAGDEIWTFSSSDESWENLAGRAGIALVRDGHPVVAIVTIMN